ncbi:hypothetical protein CPT_Madawaska_259 [Staphylococcus phage Madawaska]|nr:hypothetical protein CPT_Madawaska_259 [Staphylococcus phage Madawaska]
MDFKKTFNTDIMKIDRRIFYNIINVEMSLSDKRKMYNKVNDENEILTYVFDNYTDNVLRNNEGIMIMAKDLNDFIRHSIFDYYFFYLIKQFLPSSNFQNFEDFVIILEGELFKPKQETLSQFSSKEDMIYVYYNTTLNKIIIVDHIMFLKALMEYIKEEKDFYEDLYIEFEKEVKKYLVENNFK